MRRRGDKRRRASKRPLNAVPIANWKQEINENDLLRATQVLVLRAELNAAYDAERAGKRWRLPFPPRSDHDRSDGDVVALAFAAWASGSADDDQISAVLYPHEYRAATQAGSTAREALILRVRERRHKYEAWRDGRPFKVWMHRPYQPAE